MAHKTFPTLAHLLLLDADQVKQEIAGMTHECNYLRLGILRTSGKRRAEFQARFDDLNGRRVAAIEAKGLVGWAMEKLAAA